MEEEAPPPPDARWCFGLPCEETAELRPDEAARIRRRVRARGLRLLWTAALTIVVPTAACALGAAFPHSGDVVQGGLALLAMLSGLVGVAATILTAMEAARERARLARDLREGRVLVFRGAPPNPAIESAYRALAGVPDTAPIEVRVLPHASLWLAPAGGRAELQPVRIRSAAAPPSYAWRVPVHDDLTPKNVPPGVRFEQRRLTPSELREIAAYAQRLLEPGAGALALTAFVVLEGVAAAGRMARGSSEPLGDSLLLCFLPILVFRYIRRVFLARRLRVDLQAGRAITAVPAARAAEGDRDDRAAREFLPVSGATWTEAGRPAVWRDTSTGLFRADLGI